METTARLPSHAYLVPSQVMGICEVHILKPSPHCFNTQDITLLLWHSSNSPCCCLQLVVMVLCAIFLLPETKGVPIERVQALYARHWFWNR